MGTTRFPVYKNLSLDTKIMSLCALELKIWHLFMFEAAILKIQDGRHLERILVITTGIPIPENMVIDTKIMSLHGLEINLEGQIGGLAAILKSLK